MPAPAIPATRAPCAQIPNRSGRCTTSCSDYGAAPSLSRFPLLRSPYPRFFLLLPYSVFAFPTLPVCQSAQHPVDTLADRVVHKEEVHPEQEHRDDHHGRRSLHFFKRRRGDLLHFGAHVVIKASDAQRQGLYAATKTIVVRGCCN